MFLCGLISLRCRNFKERCGRLSVSLCRQSQWVLLPDARRKVPEMSNLHVPSSANTRVSTENKKLHAERLCGCGMKQITHRGSPTDKWIKSGYVFTRVNIICNSGIQYSRNAHNGICNCWFTLRLQGECTVPSWRGKPQCATVSVKSSVSDPPAPTLEITTPGNPMPKNENFPTVVSSQTENELDVQKPNLRPLTLWERALLTLH